MLIEYQGDHTGLSSCGTEDRLDGYRAGIDDVSYVSLGMKGCSLAFAFRACI